MKKSLFFAAALVVAMSSCSKSSVIESDITPEAIGFESFIDKSTKAADITVANIGTATVKGYYTEEDWASHTTTPMLYFDRALTIDTDGAADYTNPVYWPTSGGKVSFFAYAPVSITAVTAAVDAKDMAITFTTPATVADQTDFVTAKATDCVSAGGAVDLEFDHVLSKIGFSAKSGDTYAGLTFKVTALEVSYAAGKVVSSGTYSFGATPWTLSTSDFLAAGATGSMLKTTTGGVEIPTDGSTSTATNLVADNAYMMLIPQDLEDGDLTVKITYTTLDANSASPLVPITTKKTIALDALTLAQGTYYNYIFTIGANVIEFAKVEVNDWTPGTTPGLSI